MLAYATLDALTAQGVPIPDDAQAMLEAASGLVADATGGAVYATDADGLPIDSSTLSAMRDATVVQVRYWAAAGINPLSAGMDLPAASVSSRSQGGRSVSYSDLSTSVTVQQARQQAAVTLCGQAWGILARAGLTQGQPATA